ncbi:hypothetical protein CHCC20335_3406 [Bacillus paralicheniformis]|nr:hypothetical protein CHCC20335_3406 [Bacillus paralicheniformis]
MIASFCLPIFAHAEEKETDHTVSSIPTAKEAINLQQLKPSAAAVES